MSFEKIKGKFMEALDAANDYSMDDFKNDFNTAKDKTFEAAKNMFKFDIKFVNKSDNENFKYETVGSAGFDLRSNENVTLKPLERAVVKTGLFFELPPSLEMQIRPRSGLAAKHGITVLNSPGTIDSDYRGEIGVILINLGSEPFEIKVGERIAQAVIATVTADLTTNFIEVSELDNNTERGTGGFGSTGVK